MLIYLNVDPVFYCNDLGKEPGDDLNEVASSARSCTSIKEAVRFASNNNLMGLICSSRLLVSPFQVPNMAGNK